MPTKPRSRCTRCKRLHSGTGKCATCKARDHKTDTRPNSGARGYGWKHREVFRKGVLNRDPTCVLCKQAPATHADHWPLGRDELVVRGLDPNDPVHGRGLCASCDSRQTAQRQPGGFNSR